MKPGVLAILFVTMALSACGGESNSTDNNTDMQDDVTGVEVPASNDPPQPEVPAPVDPEPEVPPQPTPPAAPEPDSPPAPEQPAPEPEPLPEPEAQPEPTPSPDVEPAPDAEEVTTDNRTYGAGWTNSAYDHQGVELNGNGPLISTQGTGNNNPIRYQRVFDRERELFGYNPRYLPGRPYFDSNNLPWIVVNNQNQLDLSDSAQPRHISAVDDTLTGKALHEITYDERLYSNRYSNSNPCQRCDHYVLRLTKEGQWKSLSIKAMAQRFGFEAPAEGFALGTRYRRMEQVYFQNNGDIYIKANHGLLHYRWNTDDWAGYPRGWIGRHDMVGDGQRPPIFINQNSAQTLFSVQRLINAGTDDARWEVTEIYHGEKLSLYFGNQSVIYAGDELHIAAYNASDTVNNRQPFNTAQAYVRYNFVTGSTDTLFMGWTGGTIEAPDNHNQPILLIDSNQKLHYLSGAHGHNLWHRQSLLSVTDNAWNNDGNAWSADITADDKFTKGPSIPVNFDLDQRNAEPGVNYIGGPKRLHTYPHARIDKNNIIHLVVRETIHYTLPNEGRMLYYYQGRPDANGRYTWIDRGNLVYPNWSSYSNYKQKVNLDRTGGIYSVFMYEIQNVHEDTWFNHNTRNRFRDPDLCAADSSINDCINVFEEHNRRWPDDPMSAGTWNGGAGSSWGIGQNHPINPVLIGSYDAGDTWKIITTDDFLSRQQ